MSTKGETRIYVGNLPPDTRVRDIEDLFYKYGKIIRVDLKNRKINSNTCFAFVEFDDPRDAEDAVDRRDGYDYDGCILKVEFPKTDRDRGGHRYPRNGYGGYQDHGGYQDRRGGFRGGGFRGGFGGGRGGYGANGRGYRRTQNRVLVTGLPVSGSWQDLKDHMREAGDVSFADVYRDGTGVVEFVRYDDMKYAVNKLDDTKFRSHEGDTSYIRVREDTRGTLGGGGYEKRSRSKSNSRSRSRSAGSGYGGKKGAEGFGRSRSRSHSKSDN